MKTESKRTILLAVFLLLGASLACNLFRPGPEAPAQTIPVTTEAVESLKVDVQQAATQAVSSGKITLEVDEAELTSLVTFELQQMDPPPLTDVQVHLQDGKIIVSGNAQQENLTLPVVAAATVKVDDQGQPDFNIESAKIGPFSLPERIVSQLTDQLRAAFNENVRPRMGDVVLESITITDGKMVIEGQTR